MSTPTVAADPFAEVLFRAVKYHRAGRFTDAVECCRTILATDPHHADALHLLGIIEQIVGNYRHSAELISAAIRINPRVSDYYNNLGHTLRLSGDLPRAATNFQQAFALNRNNIYALESLARIQAALNKPEEAAATGRLLLSLKRRSAAEHCQLGDLCKGRGDSAPAEEHYRKAVSLQPRSFEAQFKLASLLFLQRQFADSTASFRRAAELKPDDPAVHYSLGVALQAQGELHEAAEAYHRALVLKPDYLPVFANLAAIFTELGNLELSGILLRRAIELDPDSPVALCNLGALLSKQNEPVSAAACFKRAIELRPGYGPALCNLGLLLELDGDLDGAERYYKLAIEGGDNAARSRLFLSQIHLARGQFAEGWQELDARWETPKFLRVKRDFPQPQWRGEPIAGARILIFSEQGLGDTLQFVRYLPMMVAAGATVYFEVQPELFGLLGKVAGAAKVYRRDADPLPEFDWQCPLMSLPLAFHTEIDSIPRNVPYIRADEARTCLWSERLPADRFKVGIVWSGNPNHVRQMQRSVPCEKLARLSRIPGTAFYSLQKGPAAGEADSLPEGLHVANLDAQQRDFADTAAIVANLDLVITIDTSVAHLAGAMGKPVWILLHNASDWRWMRDREDCPWYPTARLFRQTSPGDWDGVLERVEARLTEMVADSSMVQGVPGAGH